MYALWVCSKIRQLCPASIKRSLCITMTKFVLSNETKGERLERLGHLDIGYVIVVLLTDCFERGVCVCVCYILKGHSKCQNTSFFVINMSGSNIIYLIPPTCLCDRCIDK